MAQGSQAHHVERTRPSVWTSLVVAGTGIVALALGLMAGIDTATTPRVPVYTYRGIVGAVLPGVLLLLGLIVTLIVGVLALVVRRRWLVACFMLGAGYIGGQAGGVQLARATGQAWEQQPIVYPSMPTWLGGFGTASGRLDGVPGFVSRTGGAECHSGPNSQTVASVYAEDAGRLQGAMLRIEFSMHGVTTDPDLVGIPVIYFWSPDMTGAWPSWAGQGTLVETGPMSGRITFRDLTAVPARDPQPGTWPATLSGEVVWTCEAWQGAAPGAIEVPDAIEVPRTVP